MSGPYVVLDSPETLRRIIDGIRWVERIRCSTEFSDPMQGAVNSGATLVTVKVTGSTVTEGTREGEFVLRNTESAHAWFTDDLEGEGQICRVVDINDEDLTQDRQYVGYLAGELEFGAFVGLPLVVVGVGWHGFHAKLVSGSGGGPWTIQEIGRGVGAWVNVGDPKTDAYAKAWRDGITPNPQAGDFVWAKRSVVNPTTPARYEFISHPNFNCGFDHNPAFDEYAVNVEQLAGDGLTFSEGGEGCDQLDINYGCGLDIVADELIVDTLALAGPGLGVDGTCGLKVNVGCGIQISSDALEVKASDLAGAGLVTDGTCGLRVNVGCGLFIESDVVKFDNVTVAGTGLGVEGACALKVNVGCGLEVFADAVRLNLTDVVFDGLYWDNSICALGVLVGCGLEYGPGEVIQVDNVAVAGDRSETAMVPSGGCSVGVDLVSDHTTTEQLDKITGFGFVGGLLRLSWTRYTFTNYFNIAGLHIDRQQTGSSDMYAEVDVCDVCNETPPECEDVGYSEPAVSASADDTSVCAGVTVNFSASVLGGLAPYTWVWIFGDGGTSTSQNPSHAYTTAGTYDAQVTVTDACGNQSYDIVTVTVTNCGVPVEGCSNDVPSTLYGTFTGDFAFIGTITFVFDGVDRWEPTAPGPYEVCPGVFVTLNDLFTVNDCEWNFSMSDGGTNGWSFQGYMSFGPLSMTMGFSPSGGTCDSGTTGSMVVSDIP
jgi:hypothetical protein